MEIKIEEFLMNMGFEPSQKGFGFIVKSVVVILKNNNNPMKVSDIYNEVCGDEGIKYCTYDRLVRYAIESSYLKGCDLYCEFFNGQIPKLKDALYRIALKMKMIQEGE